MARIKFGMRAKDVFTGFEGIVTAHVLYMTQCDKWEISGPAKDGKPGEIAWFDVTRIEILDEKIAQLVADAPAGPAPG